MIPVVLFAVVTGVSPDGLFLNEGAADGVRAGDAVTLGNQKLQVVELGPHHSRTGPVADPFVIRVGAKAEIAKSGTASGAPPAPVKLQPAPKLENAATLWPAAQTGWETPRPFEGAKGPGGRATASEAETWRLRGDLSLTSSHFVPLEDGEAVSVGTLGSRLDARRGALRYAHDLRFNAGLPLDEVNESHPYVEPRGLELGWNTPTWGVRGGRLADTERLASGPVDGAAFRLSSPGERLRFGGQVYGGLVPAYDTLEPTLDDRTVGLGADLGGEAGDLRYEAGLGANTIAHGSTLSRVVAGPQLTLSTDRLVLHGFVDADFEPAFTLSQVYASAFYALTTHADVGLRYGRLESPAFSFFADGVHHDAWLDSRLDIGSAGTFSPRIGYLRDPDGDTWLPGLDWRVPLSRAFDLFAGYDYARGPWQESHQGRGRVTWRLDGDWLAELDLGARGTQIYPDSGPEDLEKTAELGAWMRLPHDFDLHLYAEGTAAWQNRVVALADLRWRFRESR